ncbi:MAG: hypothetical protein UT82_C0009G0009 [Parcubacteria group bacterium GW2011_GWB1_40_14]|nr:MAG: hypothetical protein UT82_C0009G0009 [Parcubacteria group bacterium GW2011_GWB1_40_14]
MLSRIDNKKIFYLFILSVFLVLPVLSAQAAIVTCDKCTLCDLFVVGKNIIDLLWWQISFPIAVLMMVLAAFFFIISGGNPSLHTRGKSIATAAVVGLFITFGSWLIVSVFINTLANTGAFPWPWNKPSCTITSSSSSGGYTCVSPNICADPRICNSGNDGIPQTSFTCPGGEVCCSFR